MRTHNHWWRRLRRAERGASIVEYTAVSGLALLLAGLIVGGLSHGRFTLGAAMAGVHSRQISAFGTGSGGTAAFNGALYPHPRAPRIPTLLLLLPLLP